MDTFHVASYRTYTIGSVDLFYFIPFLVALTLKLVWESQDREKARSVGFVFTQTAQLKKMKLDMVIKQFDNWTS